MHRDLSDNGIADGNRGDHTAVTQWHDIETFYITIIQEQLSAHSAAASPAEMSTSLIILCFSCLVLGITARNFRSDYNYEYYDNQNQWNDHSNDYHYEWKDHTEGIGQTCFEKYGVIRKEIFVQRKEASPSGGQSVECGLPERSTLRATRWTQIKIFLRKMTFNS